MKRVITLFALLFALLNAAPFQALSAEGDTTVVQTFTFGSTLNDWFLFPPDTGTYQRIFMLRTLKCVPGNNPACGEWDYLTYTRLFDHTGVLDSTLLSHPNFVVDGGTPDTFKYSLGPAYQYIPRKEYFTVRTGTSSFDSVTVGMGSTALSEPLTTTNTDGRYQYLWTVAELTAAGLPSGNITGLRLDVASVGTGLGRLTIKMKETSDTVAGATFDDAGLATVFDRNYPIVLPGWNTVPLTTDFPWSGFGNILIEISFDHSSTGTTSTLNGATASFTASIGASESNHYLDFEGRDLVNVPPAAFSNIDSVISIAFWQYGDPSQAKNDNIFEGFDANNNRVLNSHLPWGNGQVYWDCGNDAGNHDRINKTANAADFKDQWNHWTFVKSAKTGVMAIWLNGELWHTGTGKVRDMTGLTGFYIGSNRNRWGNYDGFIDEFSVWNTVLDSAGIAQLMFHDITPSHPDYANLQLYYRFNEGAGSMATDDGPGAHHGTLDGMPQWINGQGPSLWRNYSNGMDRPNVMFEQGVYTSHIDSMIVVDSMILPPINIVIHGNPSDPTAPTDTIYAWNEWYNKYTYNANGDPIDSTYVTPDSTLYRVDMNYYSAPFEIVDRIELGRYITPYGIGLDLGDGWTWIYDVTDYEPYLHDSVHLTSGNWQELLDMKFLFIEGTPPREVLEVENIWNGGQYGYGAMVDDNVLQEKDVMINPAGSTFRVMTRATGHGFGSGENCAEFCDKIHYLDIDGVERDDWHVWMGCSDNALYPQGGTWVYNRAGWCPGAICQTNYHEITDYVTPGQTHKFDYRVQGYQPPGTGEGNYRLETQLITYGPITHTLDARLDEILAPSTHELQSRHNPICANPEVVIRNTGSDTLTYLEITYGVVGGTPCTYNYWGSLAFMDTAHVILPLFDWSGGTESTFYATVGNPNQGMDQYAGNNTAKSAFEAPPRYDLPFEVWMRTNNAPHENQWGIYDDQDSLIFGRSSFIANRQYRDTFNLAPGCYRFELIDWDASNEGGDGLSWWANSDGTGYVRFKQIGGPVMVNFEPDFGFDVYHEFTVGYDLEFSPPIACATGIDQRGKQQMKKGTIEVFPNPTEGLVTIDMQFASNEQVEVRVVSILGTEIYHNHIEVNQVGSYQIDLSGHPAGTYMVTVKTAQTIATENVLLLPTK
jgi:hypothetical protein